jgi:predicted TPR repeat methyltransferase
LRFLEKAIALVPDDPVILEHLGDAYEKTGALAEAVTAYRKAQEKAKEEDREKIGEKIRDLESRIHAPSKPSR